MRVLSRVGKSNKGAEDVKCLTRTANMDPTTKEQTLCVCV